MAKQSKITCENLLEKIKTYNPQADFDLIRHAFDFATETHKDHVRRSGEPYIIHPLAVAEVLADLEQNTTTIAAALLHDTIEDGGITPEEITSVFGEEIALLVSGVTKLGQLVFDSREERQAESFRKMFLAMGEDIRVIIIKLADRLHNMQTLKYLSKEKQKEISLETRDIFAPLAHRLGMWKLKWELEDIAFKYLESDKFEEIKSQVTLRREEREKYVTEFIERVKIIVAKAKIEAQIFGRPKHFYSIYQKLVEQHLEFDEVFDLIAVRIIVPDVRQCYEVLGIIHASWKPIPGRFRDYIAMPKPNGYQSLHTTVVGPGGRAVEVQIRTRDMHRIAEYGVAAHWRYKEKITDKAFDEKLTWLRQVIDWQTGMKDAREFMESLKIDLFTDEVFVFTPKGDVRALPLGATPVDFAYHVHTEVGHRCQGAKVNGRIVPLNHKLKNGDIIEILAGKKDSPKIGWLNFIKTSAARTKIKQWLKKQKKEDNITCGKEMLVKELKELFLDPDEVLQPGDIGYALEIYRLGAAEDLYCAIGYGEISAYQVARRLREHFEKEHGVKPLEEEIVKPIFISTKPKKKRKEGIKVMGIDDVLVRFSKCCRPLPGDEIVGFVTKGRGVSIHRKDCANIAEVAHSPDRVVKVEWDPTADQIYPVEVEVEAFDRVGVLKDILAQIAEIKTNISAANVRTKRGTSAIIKLVVDVKSADHLHRVFDAIKKVSDVIDVYRVRP